MRKVLTIAALTAVAGFAGPAVAGDGKGYAGAGFGCGAAYVQTVAAPEPTEREKALATVDDWLERLRQPETTVAQTPMRVQPPSNDGS